MLSVDPSKRFILASSSPRRSELLRGCGLTFEVIPSTCDEAVLSDETPQAMVERLAFAKANEIAERFPSAWVLGADTTVVIDDKILGKPADAAEATRMLERIVGREHVVWGGIALISVDAGVKEVRSYYSAVEMGPLSAPEIAAYIATGEPMDKAGSYAIQGVGAHLVASVKGSYTNVVGLNLAATIALLKQYRVVEVGGAHGG